MVLSKEVKDRITEVDTLIADLNKKLVEEENVINFKIELALKLNKELSRGFITTQIIIDLSNQLKPIVQAQDSAIISEIKEIDEIKEDINEFKKFSSGELNIILNKYSSLRTLAGTDKNKLSKLGVLLKRFVTHVKRGASPPNKLWDMIQILRKTIEKEIDLGGDLENYQSTLVEIKIILGAQLDLLTSLIRDGESIQKPTGIVPLDRLTQPTFMRLRRAAKYLESHIESERNKEAMLKNKYPKLHERYIDVRNTVIPDA